MKRLYGIIEDGEVLSAWPEFQLESVEMVPNYTWEPSDYTDDQGENWIRVDRLAELFNDLCGKTGMKKQVLATLCGKSAVSFSRYCNGVNPVPFAIWKIVEMEVRKRRGREY